MSTGTAKKCGDEPERGSSVSTVYTFDGWEPAVADTVTADTTYTAKFTESVRKYTITWMDNDGETVLAEEEIEYGTTPSREGPTRVLDAPYSQTFAGWSPVVAEVTENATYTATYTARTADLSKLASDWTAQDGDVIVGNTTYRVTIPGGVNVTLNGIAVTGAGGGAAAEAPEFDDNAEVTTTGFVKDKDGNWTLTVFAEIANDAVGGDVANDQIKVYAADTVEGLKDAEPLSEGVMIEEKKSAVKTKIKVTPPSGSASQFFIVGFGE